MVKISVTLLKSDVKLNSIYLVIFESLYHI